MTPGAPPSTPDPRRFLLSRRGPSASQSDKTTPGTASGAGQYHQQQQNLPGSGGGNASASASQRRFQTAPHFVAPPPHPSASATHTPKQWAFATPRPLPSSTQQGFVLPGSTRSAQRRLGHDPIHDDDDDEHGLESSSPGQASPTLDGTRPRLNHHDSVEVDSDAAEESDVGSESIVGDSEGQPTPKRRRVQGRAGEEPFWEVPEDRDDYPFGSPTGVPGSAEAVRDLPELTVRDEEMLPDAEASLSPPSTGPSLSDGMDLSDHDETARGPKAQQQQPTFHRAPRFKPSEAAQPDPRGEGLPEAFSPQRRGAKYLPGGLAAEMQSWLAEVRGWAGDHDRLTPAAEKAATLRVVVDGVSPGNRMYLVKGRRLGRGDIPQGSDLDVHADAVPSPAVAPLRLRLMLAGEGKLTGLARGASVTVGCVVTVSQPAWEVALQGQGTWLVACEWAVEKDGQA